MTAGILSDNTSETDLLSVDIHLFQFHPLGAGDRSSLLNAVETAVREGDIRDIDRFYQDR